jgi:hypothetical protein
MTFPILRQRASRSPAGASTFPVVFSPDEMTILQRPTLLTWGRARLDPAICAPSTPGGADCVTINGGPSVAAAMTLVKPGASANASVVAGQDGNAKVLGIAGSPAVGQWKAAVALPNTFSAYVLASPLAATYQGLLGMSDATGIFELFLEQSNFLSIRQGTGLTTFKIAATASAIDGTPHLFGLIFNATTGRARVYFDGAILFDYTPGSAPALPTDRSLRLGGVYYSGNAYQYPLTNGLYAWGADSLEDPAFLATAYNATKALMPGKTWP